MSLPSSGLRQVLPCDLAKFSYVRPSVITEMQKEPILSEPKILPPEAIRALAEAEERRKKAKEIERPKELGGRDGPEPVRYGDWERKGIAVDF